MIFRQDAIEQGGLARAQIAGQHGYGNAFGHHFLRSEQGGVTYSPDLTRRHGHKALRKIALRLILGGGSGSSGKMDGLLMQALSRVVKVRPDEARAMLWAFVYFFCLLSSYYILRPLRDESGVEAGVGNLQWLFTGTFFVMLAAAPLFGALVTRVPRRRFIPWVYRFFAASLMLFFALGHLAPKQSYVAGAFFMWVSV